MRQEQWFCLFQGDAGPMAVSAESVAEVLETDSLVRLAWSPPQVVGLCPYHREVVPVVRLATLPPDHAGRSLGASAATRPSAEKPDGDDQSRCILLILRTEHGAWGIRSDSVWTVMSRECPEYHPPRADCEWTRCWSAPSRTQEPATAFSTSRRPGTACDLPSAAGTD